MVIYTSHYFNSTVNKDKHYTVQISDATIPNKKPDAELSILYPPDDLRLKYKSGTIKADEFLTKYEEFINTIDVAKLKSDLDNIMQAAESSNKQVVLICWESDKNTCHRSIISNFIQKNFDIVCMEL